MPELPDIAAYISALESRIVAQPVERVRLASPFLLRTAQPPLTHVEGRVVRELRRIGKRIAIGVEGNLWLVLHLMIAGRLHWQIPRAKLAGRRSLAAFDFPSGSLVLTEAGTKHRASLYVVTGEEGLRSIDPGGIDIFTSDLNSFRAALTAENRTLKRALTDPRIVSGIGNAYSDEILHAAQLSPVTLTHKLGPGEWERLFAATRNSIGLWIDRLRSDVFGKATFCLPAQAVYPEPNCVARGSEQPFPLARPKLVRERDRGQLRGIQDLVRIGIADAADDAWIGKSPLERAVFGCKGGAKRIEIAREDIDSSGIDGTQTLFARDDIQRCSVLCTGFGKHERTAGKIESRQTPAARELRSWDLPVQAAGNHQVQHQPEIAFYSNRDSLADSPQFAHDAALHMCKWWLCGPQQKRTGQAHSLDRLRDDT